MNRPNPTPPPARRNQLGLACMNSLMGSKERTGVTMPVEILLRMVFDAGSGELVAEAETLSFAFYDLDGKTKQAVALEDLATAVNVEVLGACSPLSKDYGALSKIPFSLAHLNHSGV